MNIKKYQEIVKNNHKEEPIFKDCFFAFLSGGIIGLIGQDYMIYIVMFYL